MIAFTKDRFKYENWIDRYPEPWQRRSRKKTWGKKKNDTGRALLVKSGRLRRSVRIISTTANSVTIGSDVPYARAHNDGFKKEVLQEVSSYKRKITRGKMLKSGKRSTKTKETTGYTHVKFHIRAIKQNIPRRRFMGESKYLNMQISRMITAEVNKIFNT